MRSRLPLLLGVLAATGLLVPAGATATSAKVKVPAVAGKSESSAKRAITGAGLKVKTARAASATVGKGRAISSDPRAGRKVRKGSTVTVLISTGKPKAVTYTGSGTVDSVDTAAGSLDVSFDDANPALQALLDDTDDDVLGVLIGDDTDLTISHDDLEDPTDDLSVACFGDDVTVKVVSPEPLDAIDDIDATSVQISTGENSDCEGTSTIDDPSVDDPSVDDPSVEDPAVR